jgi:biopolymer transport protein ExbB
VVAHSRGGLQIWPLIAASIVALALIFERLWSLRQSVVAPAGMVDHVLVIPAHRTYAGPAQHGRAGPARPHLAAGPRT